jgi:hypothetical protein
MAKDENLPRYFIKICRDGAKSKYDKGSFCEICGTTEELHFHHFNTLSILINKWVEQRGLVFENFEHAVEWRDKFIAEHQKELYEDAATLCKEHHQKLHSLYGKNPILATAPKQARWVQKMKEKHGKKLEILE